MFRVLSSLVQCVGTCFLLVGLVFQIYSLNSNKWITWTTDSNEGLSYFEGKQIFAELCKDDFRTLESVYDTTECTCTPVGLLEMDVINC